MPLPERPPGGGAGPEPAPWLARSHLIPPRAVADAQPLKGLTVRMATLDSQDGDLGPLNHTLACSDCGCACLSVVPL